MVDLSISTEIFPLFDDIAQEIQSGSLSPALTYQTQIDLFSQALDLYDPTVESLSSTRIALALQVPGAPAQTFHVSLTGTGISPVSSMDALIQAIGNGVATGSFTQLAIDLNSTRIATLAFSASGYTLTSGADSVTVHGALPTSFAQLGDLTGLLMQANMETIDAMTASERADYFDALGDYGITGLAFTTQSGGTTTTILDLEITDTGITLSNAMISLVLSGTIPTDFGEVAAAAYEIYRSALANGGVADPSDLTLLGMDSLVITDAHGTELLNLDGSVLSGEPIDATITGTTGADSFYWNDLPFDGETDYASVTVALGAGNDTVRMDLQNHFDALTYWGYSGDELSNVSIDAGAGTDTLIVQNWVYQRMVEVNLGSGTLSGYSWSHDWWNYHDDPLWSDQISGFETVRIQGQATRVIGSAAAETVVVTNVQNGIQYGTVYLPAVTFDAGLGSDVLDLSRMSWWDGSTMQTGLTQAELSSTYSFSVDDDGFLILQSSSGYNSLVPELALRGVEYLQLATSNGGTQLFSLSNIQISTTLPTIYGDDFIGGDNSDRVTGSDAAELIHGGNGNDILNGYGGDDSIYGDDGGDTLSGGEGNDIIVGGTSTEDLRDVIYGGNGNDTIDGGYGNDDLRGEGGNDVIEGGFGADSLYGGIGNDSLSGSALSDLIFGGDGNDYINGGFGFDRVNGGAGADRFYHLGVIGHGTDWIQDYSATDNDVLIFGNASATGSQFQINWATTAGAGDAATQEAFVVYRPTGQIIWALVDGAANDHIWLQIGGHSYDLLA